MGCAKQQTHGGRRRRAIHGAPRNSEPTARGLLRILTNSRRAPRRTARKGARCWFSMEENGVCWIERAGRRENGAGRGESFLLLSSHGRQQQGAGHVRRPGKNGARLLEKKAGQRGGVAMGDLHEHPPPELRGRRALGGGVRALGAGNRELAAGRHGKAGGEQSCWLLMAREQEDDGWGKWQPGGAHSHGKIIGQRGARPCPGTGAMGKLELAGRGTTICCRARAGAWGGEMPWRQQRAATKPCCIPARSWFPCEDERW
jgi:hypothetical protein